uniref:Uncharacterized protein n=1 Tax=Kalanchoe fedtschenkoi TaxID=63787 RepID=A0A7N0RH95_KALFE
MSSQKLVTVKDLIEEGKKRSVFLAICVVGLSYIMSLTSSSVLVNLPAALLLVIILRYFSLDFEMRRKAIIYTSCKTSKNAESSSKPSVTNKTMDMSEWKRKVNSPPVEKALDQFTQHLVSEWVTNLWYSRITPDKEGPEELVHLINGVLGEISFRMKNVNLVDLLTRDIINLICSHLKVFRVAQAKMKTPQLGSIALENQDRELKVVLAAEDKLHPALFSPEAEHKVLQHLISGLISYTFKSEDLQCNYFRYTVRELIACAVIRPVVNLANPRFINERIENLVKSRMNASKGSSEASETSQSKAAKMSRLTSDLPLAPEDAASGVELVPLKEKQPATSTNKMQNEEIVAKDPLLSVDTRSSRSWSSTTPSGSCSGEVQGTQWQTSGGEWGDVLDKMSHRKTQALAPENIENMWAKGRNFKKNESHTEQVPPKSVNGVLIGKGDLIKAAPQQLEKNDKLKTKNSVQEKRTTSEVNGNKSSTYVIRKQAAQPTLPEEPELSGASSSSYTSEEEEEANIVTGLDSPEIKVWDSKKNKNVSVVHHPLESVDGRNTKKLAKGHTSRTLSGRKRFKVSSKKVPLWKEVQRTSFLSGDGQDILNPTGHDKNEESSDEYEVENLGRRHSSLTASSSASFLSVPESQSASANHVENVLLTDAFLRLRCEVAAANIVRSDSGTFAVYSISVTDVNNNNWSIKRRFRHFEELHRRLKEYSEYNLHLPPKHFLTTGSDMSVIHERSQLLDKYLKRLMQLPAVSSAVEVWDFLSVDSQTYTFSNSFSIIETLPVRRDNLSSYGGKKISGYGGSNMRASANSEDPRMQTKHTSVAQISKVNAKQQGYSQVLGSGKDSETRFEDPDSDLEIMVPKKSRVENLASNPQRKKNGSKDESQLSPNATDPSFPAEWVPPNLSVPLLDLVDVILQIEDGGWIRRKAFWVAKQLLHLGMGDALDDWLLEKIQRLRQGSLVASGIGRVEQILWPDGIFITKHPKRQRPPNASPPMSPSDGRPPTQPSPRKVEQDFEEQQRQEADRRARLVYELMIDKAPAAVVRVIGRKEYEHCAKDLYFFIQVGHLEMIC